MRRSWMILCLWSLFTLAPAWPQAATPSPTPSPTPPPHCEVHGFFSASYNVNTAGQTNRFRVFDNLGDGQVQLDDAELVFLQTPLNQGDVGYEFDFDMGIGPSTIPGISFAQGDPLHTALGNPAPGTITTALQGRQYFVSYIAPLGKGLRIDLGHFVSPMGYESIPGWNNWNDNASLSEDFGFAMPYSHFGLRFTYPLSDRLTAVGLLVNGWDDVVDNNSSHTVGGQLQWSATDKLSVNGTWIGGPELPDAFHDYRSTYDLTAEYRPNKRLTFAGEYTTGADSNALVAANNQTATWNAEVGWVRYSFTDRFYLSLRGESFNDPQGFRLGGGPQVLSDWTLTPEYHLDDNTMMRLDIRADSSDHPVFLDRNGRPTSGQNTLLLNMVRRL